MRPLNQMDFLALWEKGNSLHPLDKGIMAVQAAFPEMNENIADWPIGRRNRALAEMRRAAFAVALRGWSQCPYCGEQLEFEIDGNMLAEGEIPEPDACVVVGGKSYRLPTSRDLAAVVNVRDENAAARMLLKKCCISKMSHDSAWSDDEVEEIGQSMAAADPLAEILLSFDCPNCETHFDKSLDMPSFFWAEMESQAKRLLMEVHMLASAYGWSQSEILSLSPVRRNFYLDMVRS